jgi:hypothetical protein
MPDATLQAAVVLALRTATGEAFPRKLPETVSPLLEGYVAFLERIQNRDGSFDQIYPNEKAPGVVHDILSALVWLWRSALLGDDARRRLERVMERAVAYALRSDEKHGEIANHFAQYASELIHYGRAFQNDAAIEYGQRYLDRTLALFNEREGWFKEYDGADAGYQTRGVTFLSRIADMTGDDRLWSVLRKAGDFLDRMTMPDGALHPMLGVRSTALAYVSGIERLAERFPELAPLADRIHASWANGRAITPDRLDFENGLRIADDAFDAAEIRERRTTSETSQVRKDASFDMPDAGLHARVWSEGGVRRTVHVGTRLGGVIAVHDINIDGVMHLAFEDAGYLLQLADGTRWVMRHPESGSSIEVDGNRFSLTAHFTKALHEDMSPQQLVLLRLLNLTLLRSQRIGDIFKKLVVRRLISARVMLAATCHRKIAIDGSKIMIEDRFAIDPELSRRMAGARLFRCRRTVANHMASSRYFQVQELEGLQPWTEELPLDALDGRPLMRAID